MIGNVFVLLLVLGLAALFGWLAFRALRSRRTWVKVSGGLVGGLLTLALVAIAFVGAKGIATVYFPGAQPAPNVTVAQTPEQLARGEYLVGLSCVGCHSAVGPDGAPSGAPPLSGGWNIAAAEGFGFMGSMVAENLTPGGQLAGYTDGELFRVLRHSIDRDGQRLAFMAFLPYGQLSNEDTEAIVAYLRTLQPVTSAAPTGDSLNFLGMALYGSGMFPLPPAAPAVVTAPAKAVTAEYGKYVATFGECAGCHGADVSGSPATAMSPAVPNPRPAVATWTQDEFVRTMRTGIRPGGAPFSEAMPFRNAAGMTEEDLTALYLYLTTPVR
jgi:mono/diheme cytochrome c family protein